MRIAVFGAGYVGLVAGTCFAESGNDVTVVDVDEKRVAMLRAYTMLGDSVADAYAALLPQYGGRRLIAMLEDACANGIDRVPNAPPDRYRDARALAARLQTRQRVTVSAGRC